MKTPKKKKKGIFFYQSSGNWETCTTQPSDPSKSHLSDKIPLTHHSHMLNFTSIYGWWRRCNCCFTVALNMQTVLHLRADMQNRNVFTVWNGAWSRAVTGRNKKTKNECTGRTPGKNRKAMNDSRCKAELALTTSHLPLHQQKGAKVRKRRQQEVWGATEADRGEILGAPD